MQITVDVASGLSNGAKAGVGATVGRASVGAAVGGANVGTGVEIGVLTPITTPPVPSSSPLICPQAANTTASRISKATAIPDLPTLKRITFPSYPYNIRRNARSTFALRPEAMLESRPL